MLPTVHTNVHGRSRGVGRLPERVGISALGAAAGAESMAGQQVRIRHAAAEQASEDGWKAQVPWPEILDAQWRAR